jgi:hypothetical protein
VAPIYSYWQVLREAAARSRMWRNVERAAYSSGESLGMLDSYQTSLEKSRPIGGSVRLGTLEVTERPRRI